MADFQDQDLNYGVTLGDPNPSTGTYNPPEVNKSPSVTDQQKQQAEQGGSSNYDISKAAHPGACIATFAFKVAAIFFYLIMSKIIDSTILIFIFVILLSSLDFWTVKNITGRLLVGLRWWTEIDQNGKETWRFQNPDSSRQNNAIDSAFFWTSQLASTVIWALLFVINLISLSIFWSLLLFVCLSLSGTNLYAYYQCRGDHQKKMDKFKQQGINQIIKNAF